MKAVGRRIVAEMHIIEKTKSGLYIPETAQNIGASKNESNWQNMNYLDGTVLSVGEEVTGIKAGDKILVAANSALRVTLNGKKCALLKPEEVLGVLGPEDNYGTR